MKSNFKFAIDLKTKLENRFQSKESIQQNSKYLPVLQCTLYASNSVESKSDPLA